MFRELLAPTQAALGILCACSETAIVALPTDITRPQYTKCHFAAPPEDDK
jgi:hypothetical protein